MSKPKKGHVPEETLSELRRLNELSAQTRGGVRLGDPRREAANEFCALAKQVIDECAISSGQLSLMLGLSYDNIRLKLSRHGYLPNLPSQSNYKGQVSAGGVVGRSGRSRMRVGGYCLRGHLLTAENTAPNGANHVRCRACKNEANRLDKAAKRRG